MATTNPITGDSLVSRGYSEHGRENHDRIFGKKPSDGQCEKCGGILIRDKCEACKSEQTQAD